jgi:hypothetical protein
VEIMKRRELLLVPVGPTVAYLIVDVVFIL